MIPTQRGSFISDLGALLGSRFVIIGIGFAISIITARVLGPENRGIVSATMAIPLLLAPLGELGVRQTAQYYIAKQLRDDQSIISTIGFFNALVTGFVILAGLIIGFVTGNIERYGWLLLFVALLSTPPSFIASCYSGVLMGKGRLKLIARGEIIHAASNFLLLGLMFIFPEDMRKFGVILAGVIALTIKAAFVLYYVRQYGTLGIRYIPGLPPAHV